MPNGLQLQRYDGTRHEFTECWRLMKGTKVARCYLMTHPRGAELRLEAAGEFIRSQVFRDPDAVVDAATAWRAAMADKGWS